MIIDFIVNVFVYIIMLHWGVVSIYTILGIAGFVMYRSKKTIRMAEDVEICIVSQASLSVKNVLFECIKNTSEMFDNQMINVVIDYGSTLTYDLNRDISKIKNVNLIVVPHDFKCNAVAKGRAIEYFIQNYVKKSTWYAFIDDDNRILDKKFMYEIDYYDKRGYGACNGVLVPRLGRSKLAFVADSIRYFDDMTIFRFGTGLIKKPLNGFHGELLVTKGNILKKITFNRKTITEDFAFARELSKTNIKVWQSATRISILSPHNVVDFLKQRNRWYRGLVIDVRSADIGMKLFAGIRLIDWKIGIIGSWVIFPLWFILPIPNELIVFNMIGALYYICAYVYGCSRLKTPMDRIKYLALIPVYGILETLSPHWKAKNKNEFNVINK